MKKEKEYGGLVWFGLRENEKKQFRLFPSGGPNPT